MTHINRMVGREAEQAVIGQFVDVGWRTRTSPELDYVGSTDVVVVCPEFRVVPVQVSLHSKSGGELRRLEKEGIMPISTHELGRTKTTAPKLVCGACPRQLCASRLAPLVVR